MRTNWGRRAAWALAALAFMLGGLGAVGEDGLLWAALAVVLHLLPLGAQVLRSALSRVYGLWLALALILHFVLSAFVVGPPVPHLPANMVARVEHRGEVMPGFSGIHTITTDGVGFRTTEPVDYAAKRPGHVRIFAIGGSTTEQIDLDDRKTWSHLLQVELRASTGRSIEVVNTGVSGLRARHHVITLRGIARYAPDVAILMVGINDWNHHIRYGGSAYREWMAELVEQTRFSRSLVGRAASTLHQRFARGDAGARPAGDVPLRVNEGKYFSKQNDSLHRSARVTRGIERVAPSYAWQLQAFAATCRANGHRCLLVTQPTGYQPDVTAELRRRFWMTPPNETYTLTLEELIDVARIYNRYLVDLGAEHGLPVCDVAGALTASTDYFFDDCHFNERGSMRIAQLLSDCIRRYRLIAAQG